MDYKEQIEQAKRAAVKWREKHPVIGVGEIRVDCMVDDLTRSITDLLARAEAARRSMGGRLMDNEKLIEDLRGLLKQYGEKIPYGELVGAPWPYSRSGDLVWQDPEPYFIEQAATALSTLQAENEKLRETVDKYATAARVIALHLKPFCDESLPYDEMIADAARKASDELEQVKQERDEAVQCIRGIAKSGRVWMCPYCVHAKDTTGGIAECELDVGACMMPYSKFEWRGQKKD